METILQYIGVISAGVAGIYTLKKLVVSPILSAIRKTIGFFKKLDNSLSTLFEIQEEFRPNGGGSLRDVINRIEREINFHTSRVRLLWANIPDDDGIIGAFECDKKGNYTWVSKNWISLTGMGSESSKGNGWVSTILEEDRAKVIKEWADSIMQRRSFDCVFRLKKTRSNNIPIFVHGHTDLVYDRHGEVIGIVGRFKVTNDIPVDPN